MLGIGLGLTSMRGGQSPAGYLAARGLSWSNAGFDFSSGERWWLPSNSGDPLSAPRWATRTEWAAQFTRAGSSYYVNASGNLALAGTNELRIDYSSGSPRVLLEGASTNLTTYSGDMSNLAWGNALSNVTRTTGQADPLGGTNAATFSGSGNDLKFMRNGGVFNYTAGVAQTGSFFVKNSSSGFVQLTYSAGAAGSTQYANFSLSGDGSVTATGGSVVAQIFKLSNGWYRVSLTAVMTVTIELQGLILCLIDSGTAGRTTNTNGAQSITVWGGNQVEQDFLSSYINSVASASSRVGDVFRAPVGAENVMLGRDTFGTLVRADGLRQLASTPPPPASIIGNGGGGNILRFGGFGYPPIGITSQHNLATGLYTPFPAGDAGTAYSAVLTQSTSGRTLSARGSTVVTDPSFSAPTNRIDIGERNGGSSPDYRGYKTVAFGPTRLSDAQLLALSGAL